MITEKVIKEIYKRFRKPPMDIAELEIPKYIEMLKGHHSLKFDDGELIVESLEEFNPFRRILGRRLLAILEFERNVAIVTPSHILFLSKNSDQVRVHIKPERTPNILDRIFARGE